MIGKQKEKWMELCELAANEQDANKMIALITEINRLLEVKQQCLDTSIPAPRVSRNPFEGHLHFFGDCNVLQPRPRRKQANDSRRHLKTAPAFQNCLF
jgi:hypothetical protein